MKLHVWSHDADFCVVGGGLAGMCAAIAAARHGMRVVLMHDRPVLGGNASSEIRMWVCGAHGENMRETGIIEEIELENIHRNSMKNYSLWDVLLYEKIKFEPRITLILNCSCNQCDMTGNRIAKVRGWQSTTQSYHEVSSRYFADCSGDSILAPLSGAEFRMGREARGEFDESIEPHCADSKTMGMSCLIQARETSQPQPFVKPPWANTYESDDDLPFRSHDIKQTNFWWMELGGANHSIDDTETLRDELLKCALGVWDHIKNKGDHGAANWVLDWIGFLPGKRESRRYCGDYIINQRDVEAGGKFDDVIAYGGWSMDDHHPEGMRYPGKPTIFHPAPSPWGVPYRSIYSRNINNLFFAGRNISATHIALSSSRVMRTCAVLGQAAGTAAAVAAAKGIAPRDLYPDHIETLQQILMDDDCYLPGHIRQISELTRFATLTASEGNPEHLRSGVDRVVDTQANCWEGGKGSWVEYRFDMPRRIESCRFVFDSNLNRYYRDHRQPFHYPLDQAAVPVAPELVRNFRIEIMVDGQWQTACRTVDNHQRLVRCVLKATTDAIRFIPEVTWGSPVFRVFAWDVVA